MSTKDRRAVPGWAAAPAVQAPSSPLPLPATLPLCWEWGQGQESGQEPTRYLLLTMWEPGALAPTLGPSLSQAEKQKRRGNVPSLPIQGALRCLPDLSRPPPLPWATPACSGAS